MAVASASTDTLLFTDDDCLPDADWAESLREHIEENRDVAACFGKVSPTFLPDYRIVETEFPGVGRAAHAEAKGRAGAFFCHAITAPSWPAGRPERPTLPWTRVGSSNNLAVRRTLLLPGRPPFLPWLGAGAPGMSGEDSEFGYALMAAGIPVEYFPGAHVSHDKWVDHETSQQLVRRYNRANFLGIIYHALGGDSRALEILESFVAVLMSQAESPDLATCLSSIMSVDGLLAGEGVARRLSIMPLVPGWPAALIRSALGAVMKKRLQL
jgi:hypothetical protein